jgi:hypothetical protein
MQPDPANIREIAAVVSIVCGTSGIISGITCFFATWAVFRFRLNRLDYAVFGNGKPGLIDRFSEVDKTLSRIEQRCQDFHSLPAKADTTRRK